MEEEQMQGFHIARTGGRLGSPAGRKRERDGDGRRETRVEGRGSREVGFKESGLLRAGKIGEKQANGGTT
jgi:hypothetical protein